MFGTIYGRWVRFLIHSLFFLNHLDIKRQKTQIKSKYVWNNYREAASILIKWLQLSRNIDSNKMLLELLFFCKIMVWDHLGH